MKTEVPQKISVKKISAAKTIAVRHPVLRPGRPEQECLFEGDLESTTLHLGAFRDHHLVGVASFMRNRSPWFEEPLQYQLRGMAVLPEAQYQSIGKHLLLTGEKLLKEAHGPLLAWFNSRETAIEFYRRFGYETRGTLFEVPNVCLHMVMYKSL